MKKKGSEQPNILWIVLDQIRYDTPGFNGNTVCKTTAIDELARSGVNFRRAYTPCSLCTPARASMLTGRYAFSHGMGTNCDMYHSLSREMQDPSMFLHRRLLAAGYRCGFVGKWHVGTEKCPGDCGFEGMDVPGYGNIQTHHEFLDYLTENRLSYTITNQKYLNPDGNTLSAGVWEGPTESTPPHFLADYTIRMLQRFTDSEEPFFLTCNFWGPHPPYLPSTEFFNKHDRGSIPPWSNFDDNFEGKPVRVRHDRNDWYRQRPDSWQEWAEYVGLNYDYTAMIDSEIGRILTELDSLGIRENTAVMFTTDHGDMMGSHNQLFDKGFPYEEAHRIPLVISYPGVVDENRSCDDLVSNMDLMPTVLDLCGLSVEDEPGHVLHGRSMLPALRGETSRDTRPFFLMEFHGLRYLYSQRTIVTDDGWKYVFSPADTDEVYDLNTDSAELHNLVDSAGHSEKVDQLKNQLMRATLEEGDPLMPAVYKIFGNWNIPAYP